MDAAAEIARNLVRTTTFSLSVENEQDDAGRDSRTRHAKPNSQARTGKGKSHFPCPADDHEQDWQPSPVDTYSAIIISDDKPVAPVIQLVISKPSDVGTLVRISVQSHELGIFLTQKKRAHPVEND